MATRQNEKLTYKMYKKGRFWVFAGIVVATWNIQTLTGQAATETTTASTTSEIGTSSQLSDSQVTLSSSSNTATSDSTTKESTTSAASTEVTKADSTSTSSTDGANTNSQSNENGNKTDSTINSSASSTDKQDKQTVDSSTDAKDVTTPDPDKDSSSDSSIVDPKTTPEVVDDKVNDTKETVTPTTPAETTPEQPGTTAPETDSETNNVVNGDFAANNQLNVDDLDTNLRASNTSYLATNLMSNAIEAAGTQKMLSRSDLLRSDDAVTVLKEGDWGTSHWRLTSDGTLTIGTGVMSDTGAPWGGYFDDGITPIRAKIRKVIIEPNVVAGANASYMFFKSKNNIGNVDLTEIDGLENLDVSHATNLSFMFSGAQVSDLSGVADWHVDQATDFSYMFGSVLATTIPVENWKPSRVVDFNQMFASDKNLTSLDLSGWHVGENVASGTTISLMSMFTMDAALTSVNISGWDTSKVNITLKLFSNAGLTSLDLSSLDLRNVTSNTNMLDKNAALGYSATIKSLTLGAYSRLGQGAALPDVPNNASYTGKWVSTTDPEKTYTSAELMTLYSSSTPQADIPSEAITYVWQATPSSSVLEAKDVTVIAGPNATWQAKDSVTTLKNAAGDDILATADVNQLVTTEDVVDTTTPGDYEVTLTYVDDANTTRTATVKVNVVASQSQLIGQPVSVNQGSKTWVASDSVDATQSLDALGQAFTPAEVAKVTGTTLDTSVAGKQTVTLTYVDSAGNVQTTAVQVTVIASQAGLTTQDVKIVQGDQASWQILDHVTGATNFDGTAATDLTTLAITANTTPDLTQVGTTPITLTYTDSEGNVHTYQVNAVVVANNADFTVNPITVIAGPNASWSIADSVGTVTDTAGNTVTDLSNITADQQPDLMTTGEHNVVLTYTDDAGYTHQKTAIVNVVATQAEVKVTDSTIVLGPKTTWQAKDNLMAVIKANGDQVSADDVILENNVKVTARVMSVMYSYLRTDGTTVTVSGQVDLSQAGDNEITYTYTDSQGNTTTNTAIVTVVKSQASLDANDTTVIAGPKASFNANDQLTLVKDEFGQDVDASAVTVSGDQVDLTTPGTYQVTYHYVDGAGNVFDKTITVNVVKSQANLDANDATIIAGPKASFNANDQLTLAKDEFGQDIDASAVTVGGDQVDLTTPGTYQVTYHYIDGAGNAFDKTITVNVVKSQANLDANDTTIIAGPKANWQLSDNISAVTNEVGQTVGVQNVKVDGQVDPTTAGTYPLTLTYTDAQGNQLKKTIKVTVVASQAGIQAVDRTITLGTSWQAADNFISATDALGQAIDLSQLTVTDNVDTTTVGTYTVTYQYTDRAGNVKTTVVTVSVTDPIDENGDGDTINPTPDENNNGDSDQPATGQDTTDKPAKPVKPGQTNPAAGQTEPAATPTEAAHGATITPLVAHPANGQADQLATPGKVTTKLTAVAKPAAAPKAKLATLPQTNEAKSSSTVLGSMLLAATGLLGLVGLGRKRRHMD